MVGVGRLGAANVGESTFNEHETRSARQASNKTTDQHATESWAEASTEHKERTNRQGSQVCYRAAGPFSDMRCPNR